MLSCLFKAALWSPAGKGLASWISCVWSFLVFCHFPVSCVLSLSRVVSWVGCGTWLHRFLCLLTCYGVCVTVRIKWKLASMATCSNTLWKLRCIIDVINSGAFGVRLGLYRCTKQFINMWFICDDIAFEIQVGYTWLSMTRKCHNYTLQTNPWHLKEESNNRRWIII